MIPNVPTTINELHSKTGLLTYNKLPKIVVNYFPQLTKDYSTGNSNPLFIIHLATIYLHNSAHVFTANRITRLPTATLCTCIGFYQTC